MITHSQYLEAKKITDEYENKNFNSLESRKVKFVDAVSMMHGAQYSEEMIIAFCEYWTEHNPKGFKMRFEMQKVFDIGKRLVTWNRNDYGKRSKSDRVNQHNADQLKRVIDGSV